MSYNTPMKQIHSRNHPTIKAIAQLHTMKHRRAARLFIAEGIRSIETLLSHGMLLQGLFVTDEQKDTLPSSFATYDIINVTDTVMEKLSPSKTPPGILAIFHQPKDQAITIQVQRGLVLTGVTDPGNMGTLIRTATALALDAIFIVEGVDPWHHRVVQATAGTIGKIPLISCTWDQLKSAHHDAALCALVTDSGDLPHQRDLTKKRFIIVGSEAHGIPSQLRAQCNETMTLPMPGNIESLNAAVAGSVALYLLFWIQQNFDR